MIETNLNVGFTNDEVNRKWLNQLLSDGIVTVKFTGFAKDGQGKLIGPNGSVMDTEEFLASAVVNYAGAARNGN